MWPPHLTSGIPEIRMQGLCQHSYEHNRYVYVRIRNCPGILRQSCSFNSKNICRLYAQFQIEIRTLIEQSVLTIITVTDLEAYYSNTTVT